MPGPLGSVQTGLGNVPTAGRNPGGGSSASLTDLKELFRADFAALFAAEGGLGLLSADHYQPYLDNGTYVLSGSALYARSDAYADGVLRGPPGVGSGIVAEHGGGLGVAGQQAIDNPSIRVVACGTLSAIAANPAADTFIYLAAISGANDDLSLVLRGSVSTSILQLESNGTTSGSGNTRVPAGTGGGNAAAGTLGVGTDNIVVGPDNFYRYVWGFDPASGLFKASVNRVLIASCSPGTTVPTEAMVPFFAAATNPTAIANIHRVQGMWWGCSL